MNFLFDFYKYKKVQNFYSSSGADKKISKILYRFKSTISHQTYLVWVEFHPYDLIFIKFHLKSNSGSKYKYHLLSNLYEPRKVVFTCIRILLDTIEHFPEHHFGVIGANTVKIKKHNGSVIIDYIESIGSTKRFNLYSQFFTTFVSNEKFEHYHIPEKSVYMLFRSDVLARQEDFIEKATKYYENEYDFENFIIR